MMVFEIQPGVFAVVTRDGHQLRQHYFTKDSARAAARQIGVSNGHGFGRRA